MSVKYRSRKWILILVVLIVTSLAVIAPPLLSAWVFGMEPLVIISGTEFVSLVTLVITAYFGANVWQKRVEGDSSLTLQTDMNTENSDLTE